MASDLVYQRPGKENVEYESALSGNQCLELDIYDDDDR